MKEKFTQAVKRASETLTEATKLAGDTLTEAAQWTAKTFQTYRPTEEQLAQLKSAAEKGGRAAADAAAAFANDVLNSKLFKDAAKGAGVGAVIAVPLPLIGPMLGALIGAGLGVYVGTIVEQPALNGPSSPPNDIQITVTPIKDLAEGLRSLEGLRRDGLLTNEEFEGLKQKIIEQAEKAPSLKLQG